MLCYPIAGPTLGRLALKSAFPAVSVTDEISGAESLMPMTTTFNPPACCGSVNGTVTEGTEVCGIAEFICANGVNAVTVQLKPWLVVSVPFVAGTVDPDAPTSSFRPKPH